MSIRKSALITAAILLSLVSAIVWVKVRSPIAKADLELVAAKPLDAQARRLIGEARVVRPSEPDAVSEKVAQSLIVQLENWGGKGKELATTLRECSALHALGMRKNRSSCVDDYSGMPDTSCLIKRGYGQGTVGQSLAADRYDLNNDGIADYVISDRYYCQGLSANGANVHFVLLSRTRHDYRLAYADWASYTLEVVERPGTAEKVLIERAAKAYGTFSRILQLVDGKYVPRVCIFEDAQGYDLCDKP